MVLLHTELFACLFVVYTAFGDWKFLAENREKYDAVHFVKA